MPFEFQQPGDPRVGQPMPFLPKAKYCGFCHKLDSDSDLKLCSCCREINYCSKDCQRKDWKGHKVLCKLFAETKIPEGVEQDKYRRVIFFHPEKDEPEVLWVNMYSDYEKELLAKGHCNPDAWKSPGLVPIDPPYLPQRPQDSYHGRFWGIWLVHRDEFMRDGSKSNKSLAKAVRAGGTGLGHDWRGPVILRRDEKYNISMSDYLHAVRYLRAYTLA